MSSKQNKVDLLKKYMTGEITPKDLIKAEVLQMDSIFFTAKRRDPDLEEKIKEFELKYPGKQYVVYRIVRRSE